jgi:hypothetical protein
MITMPLPSAPPPPARDAFTYPESTARGRREVAQ